MFRPVGFQLKHLQFAPSPRVENLHKADRSVVSFQGWYQDRSQKAQTVMHLCT